MNLQTANEAVATIQKVLGLNPSTIPENEFLVEMFILRNQITSDCIRIEHAGNNLFQIGESVSIPCTDAIISADDTIDGPREKVFCLTYYGGDNIPSGPHHALVITNLTNQTLVYWRERRQSPDTQWTYNIFARAQAGFKFHPQGFDPRFKTNGSFAQFMRKYRLLAFLGVDQSAEFLAEVAYLNYWNMVNDNAISNENTAFDVEFSHDGKQVIVTISCKNRNDIDPTTFIYGLDSMSHSHSLMILDGDSIAYHRTAEQDEATEWQINCMADDPEVTDENGNPLFVGEPIQE